MGYGIEEGVGDYFPPPNQPAATVWTPGTASPAGAGGAGGGQGGSVMLPGGSRLILPPGQLPQELTFHRDIIRNESAQSFAPQLGLAALEALFANPAQLGNYLERYNAFFGIFWYTFVSISLTSGGSNNGIAIPLNTDSWFAATSLIYRTTATAANWPNTTISWYESGGSVRYMNVGAPVDAVANIQITAGITQPTKRYLARAKIFSPGSTMVFDLTDRGTGVTQTVDLVVEGYKIYKQPRPQGM